MMFALGDPGSILMVGALYFGVGIGSVVTLVWSFVRRRWSVVLMTCAVISVLFGVALASLFVNDGTSLSDDLPDWLFALVPLVCGGITCVRLLFVRRKNAA